MLDALRASDLLAPDDLAAFVRTGHVRYESGHHGDTRLALDRLVADPERLRRAAVRLADTLRPSVPDLVCGAEVGGAIVGRAVAAGLDLPFVAAAPRPSSAGVPPAYVIRTAPGRRVRGARVAVVDDAINMGAASIAAARAIEAAGGRAIVGAALVVRTPGPVDGGLGRGLPIAYLVGLDWRVWSPADCPLCRAGVPLDPAS